MTTIPRTISPILLTLLLVLASPLVSRAQEVPELKINSERYIVVDAETGQVFAQRGANDRVAIASLTKLFTAVQALNMAPLDTPIVTRESDLANPEGTAMGFGVGETYTLEDMIYGMMLPSGNDAAYAIARTLGYREGDTDEEAVQHFMDLVNERVANMGLENTFLKNPDGWGVAGHYSSAADVAAFMAYAAEYPFLVKVMGTRSYTTSNGRITVTNTNKVLNTYEPLLGGKTGYDWDSGWCLVNLAEEDGVRMIAVTLDGIAPDDWYDDNLVLLDYGFEQKRQLSSSGASFDGTTIAWTYPDRAELASVGELRGRISGGVTSPEIDAGSNTGVAQVPEQGEPVSNLQRHESAGPWLAGVSAFALVGLSGALHWRNTGRTVEVPSSGRASRAARRT